MYTTTLQVPPPGAAGLMDPGFSSMSTRLGGITHFGGCDSTQQQWEPDYSLNHRAQLITLLDPVRFPSVLFIQCGFYDQGRLFGSEECLAPLREPG